MSHALLASASFHQGLLALDDQIATDVRAQRCRPCGGALHVANYPRKLRGLPADADDQSCCRISFCCGTCRKRATPPSLRFLHRRVYAAVAVVLAMVLQQGADERRARKLRSLVDVDIDRCTLSRWRKWWTYEFPRTDLWSELRGRFDRPCDEALLPFSFLERIDAEDEEQRLIRLLEMLRPLSISPLMRRRLAMSA